MKWRGKFAVQSTPGACRAVNQDFRLPESTQVLSIKRKKMLSIPGNTMYSHVFSKYKNNLRKKNEDVDNFH